MPPRTTEVVGAAERFREAVARRDIGAMLAAFAPEAELYSPTMLRPVTGLDRLGAVFHALNEIFEEFEYTRVFEGAPLSAKMGRDRDHLRI
jgi:limonene-1,2-epoxide hydrolase